jgi:hypothetical protein
MVSRQLRVVRAPSTGIKQLICLPNNGIMTSIKNSVHSLPTILHLSSLIQWSALFLLNNYKQVEEILWDLPSAIAALQSGKSKGQTDYHQHIAFVREYLAACKSESAEDVLACEYITLLQNYDTAQYVQYYVMPSICSKLFSRKTFHSVLQYSQKPLKQSTDHHRLATAQKNAFDNVDQLHIMVDAFEQLHKIEEWWTPDFGNWICAAEYLSVRVYCVALDKLEGLVMQWLFKLAKMGLAGTGMHYCLFRAL